MNLKFAIALILCSTLFWSCKTDPGASIAELEAKIKENSNPDLVRKLIDAYVATKEDASLDNDSKSANLSKAADLYLSINQPKAAAETLTDALKSFPDATNRTANILSLASVYRNQLSNSDPDGTNFVAFMGAMGDEAKFKSESATMLQRLIDQLIDPATKRINKDAAMDYINMCEMYAGVMPADNQSPEYLIKAGEMARNVSQYSRALSIYNWVIDKFPNSDRAAQALFFKGFTLDDNMNNKEEAKKFYEEFLEKYPNDDFADDTKFLLDNLGKSDDEIIQAFEKNRK